MDTAEADRKTKKDGNNPYRHLGLNDNPFPSDAIANRNSNDPRINGTLFSSQVRGSVLEDFGAKLLGQRNPAQRYRLGYLWSLGDYAIGRGVGKTVILNYLQQAINKDWGASYFRGRMQSCCLYISPEPGMNKIEYLSVLALEELVNQKVMSKVADILTQKAVKEIYGTTSSAFTSITATRTFSKVPSNALPIEKDIDPTDLEAWVVQYLVEAGVEEQFAYAVANRNLLEYLKSMRKDHQLTFRPPPRDNAIYKKANQLFFHQAVLTLQAAGFE